MEFVHNRNVNLDTHIRNNAGGVSILLYQGGTIECLHYIMIWTRQVEDQHWNFIAYIALPTHIESKGQIKVSISTCLRFKKRVNNKWKCSNIGHTDNSVAWNSVNYFLESTGRRPIAIFNIN